MYEVTELDAYEGSGGSDEQIWDKLTDHGCTLVILALGLVAEKMKNSFTGICLCRYGGSTRARR